MSAEVLKDEEEQDSGDRAGPQYPTGKGSDIFGLYRLEDDSLLAIRLLQSIFRRKHVWNYRSKNTNFVNLQRPDIHSANHIEWNTRCFPGVK